MNKQTIRRRARDRCEYCGLPQSISKFRFVIDHIIAKQHRGKSTDENLALCCGFCNLHKGPNVSGVDPESETIVPLFHPRKDRWGDHFRRRGPWIEGRTIVGKVTIHVLAMNDPIQIARRTEMIEDDQPG